MDEPQRTHLTSLLRAAGQGDRDAGEQAAQLVYGELKRSAQYMLRMEAHQSLQPTALVHEAIVRLLDDGLLGQVPDRAYFFAAAAQAMRRILVDEARKRNAAKRGGGYQRQPFDDVLDHYERQDLDLLALDEALEELGELNTRQAQVVQMRWFVGLSVKEVALLLGVSLSTVEQDWRTARAFLRSRMVGED